VAKPGKGSREALGVEEVTDRGGEGERETEKEEGRAGGGGYCSRLDVGQGIGRGRC